MLTKLEVTMARVPEPSLRETARLALSRALGCVAPAARLALVTRLLEAPPPSSAVAALLLTRLKRDAAAEWPRPVAAAVGGAAPAGAPAPEGAPAAPAPEAEARAASAPVSASASSPFASPAMISLVEGQIGRALDASRGGSGGWGPTVYYHSHTHSVDTVRAC